MPEFDINAYESPQFPDGPQDESRHKSAAKSRLLPPAIVLILLSCIGLVMSLFSVYYALTMQPVIDPQAPELVKSFQQGGVGPFAAMTQTFFAIVNLIVIFGSISMLRAKSYPMAMTAAILAMINVGSCCCLPSLPFAIWSLVILSNAEVKQGFG